MLATEQSVRVPGSASDDVRLVGASGFVVGGTFNHIVVSLEASAGISYPSRQKILIAQLASAPVQILPIPVNPGETVFVSSDGTGIIVLYFNVQLKT
jgi:hypothetical protein